jgi:hypothetical protein
MWEYLQLGDWSRDYLGHTWTHTVYTVLGMFTPECKNTNTKPTDTRKCLSVIRSSSNMNNINLFSEWKTD